MLFYTIHYLPFHFLLTYFLLFPFYVRQNHFFYHTSFRGYFFYFRSIYKILTFIALTWKCSFASCNSSSFLEILVITSACVQFSGKYLIFEYFASQMRQIEDLNFLKLQNHIWVFHKWLSTFKEEGINPCIQYHFK